jgi:hypothetical protein
MGRLIYSAITSLDGYVADEDGNFAWSKPDEEVHTFVNDLERPIGTYLYGRRMYEVMAYWETVQRQPDPPPFILDFAEIWGDETRSSTRGRWRRSPPPGPESSGTSTRGLSGS